MLVCIFTGIVALCNIVIAIASIYTGIQISKIAKQMQRDKVNKRILNNDPKRSI